MNGVSRLAVGFKGAEREGVPLTLRVVERRKSDER